MKHKAGGFRRALAFLLTIALICAYSIPMTAFGASDLAGGPSENWEEQVVSPGGISLFQKGQSVSTGQDVEISKKIEQTGKNLFDITLKVKTKDTIITNTSLALGADVVLVLDKSGSMCDKGNRHKYDKCEGKKGDCDFADAQKAAVVFVKAFLEEKDGVTNENRIAVVAFDKTPEQVMGFSGIDGKGALIKVIQGIEPGGGTNIQGGLHEAEVLLEAEKSSPNSKYIVLLGDGAPYNAYGRQLDITHKEGGFWSDSHTSKVSDTFDYTNIVSKNTSNEHKGVCSTCGKKVANSGKSKDGTKINDDYYIAATKAEAGYAKSKVSAIYSIGVGVDDEDGAKSLLESIASGNCYYDVEKTGDLAKELNQIFKGIEESIKIATQAWVVQDPMGEFIKLKTSNKDLEAFGAFPMKGTRGLTWNLKSPEANSSVETDTDGKKVYTMKYTIELDTEADDFVEGTAYATNGTTTLKYTTGTFGQIEGKDKFEDWDVEFQVPAVSGKLPTYSDAKIEYYTIGIDKTTTEAVYLGTEKDYQLGTVTKGAVFAAVAGDHIDEYLAAIQEGGKEYKPGVIYQDPAATFSKGNTTVEVYYQEVEPTVHPPAQASYTILHKDTAGKVLATGAGVSTEGTTLSALTDNGNKVVKEKTKGELRTLYGKDYSCQSATFNRVVLDAGTQTLTAGDKNEIIFVYKEDTFGYTIQYEVNGKIRDNWSVTSGAIYQEGHKITLTEGAVNAHLSKLPGYMLGSVQYGDATTNEKLKISNNSSKNVIIVNYVNSNKIGYTVNHWKQNQVNSTKYTEFKADNYQDGTLGEVVSGGSFVLKEEALVSAAGIGFRLDHYNPKMGEMKIQAKENVLDIYYNMITAKFHVKHTYLGGTGLDSSEYYEYQVGSPYSFMNQREDGYILKEVKFNGITQTSSDGKPVRLVSGITPLEEGPNITVEFIYESGNVANQIKVNHHYEGISTPAITASGEYKPGDSFDLKTLIVSLYNGITYRVTKLFTSAEVNDTTEKDVAGRLADAVIQYDGALDGLRTDLVLNTSMAAIEAEYQRAIAPSEAAYQSALGAYNTTDAALKGARDADANVAAARADAVSAAAVYQAALDTVTRAGIQAPAGTSYGGILRLYDEAIGNAEAGVTAANETYQSAVDEYIEEAVNASTAAIQLPSLPTEPNQNDFMNATASPQAIDVEQYDAAVEKYKADQATYDAAVADLKNAEKTARQAALEGIEQVESLQSLKASVQAVGEKKSQIEAQKAAFIALAAQNTNAQLQAQVIADGDYQTAIAKAEATYQAALAASPEKKAMEDAKQAAEAAKKAAFDAKATAYREFVRSLAGNDTYKDEEIVKSAVAALDRMETVEGEWKNLLAAAGAANSEINDFMAETLLYPLKAGLDYTVNIYYALPQKPVEPQPDPDPDRPSRPGRPVTPDKPTPPDVVIKDDDVPKGEAEEVVTQEVEVPEKQIPEEKIPLAVLPKTGGIGSLSFLGIGAILSALGIALKKKEEE